MKNRKNVYKPAKELGLNMISQNKQPVQFHLEKKMGFHFTKNGIDLQPTLLKLKRESTYVNT